MERQLNSTGMVFEAIRRVNAKLRTRKQKMLPETSNLGDIESDETRTMNYAITISQKVFLGKSFPQIWRKAKLHAFSRPKWTIGGRRGTQQQTTKQQCKASSQSS